MADFFTLTSFATNFFINIIIVRRLCRHKSRAINLRMALIFRNLLSYAHLFWLFQYTLQRKPDPSRSSLSICHFMRRARH
jgi:hypothetical protein